MITRSDVALRSIKYDSKPKEKIDALITVLPKSDRAIYREIAKYAVALGYSPGKTKVPHEPVIFAKTIR